MPKKHTTYELRNLIESANKKFSNLIKKNTEVSTKYNKISEAYQQIIDLIEKNKTNSIKKLYKLEAHLGLIQCQLNSISLSPNDEMEIQINDQKIKKLETSLNSLIDWTHLFKTRITKNKADLASDYDTFLTQLTTYKKNWNTYCYSLQAAYYYNHANLLLENLTTEKTPPLVTQIEKLEKIISLFEKSSSFYEENGKIKEKNETNVEIAKANVQLEKLRQKANPINLVAEKRNEVHQFSTKNTLNHAVSEIASITRPVGTGKSAESAPLPIKKRKYITDIELNETESVNFKKTKLDPGALTEINNDITSNTVLLSNAAPIPSEAESFRNEKFKEVESSLERNYSNNNHFFYLQLFFELAKWIKLDDKDAENIFQHHLLSKFYLLETSLLLISLFRDKQKNLFSHLECQVFARLNELYTNYPITKRWILLDLDELEKIPLNETGLRQLLLSKIKNYLWGFERMTEDRKLCDDLFHSIHRFINNFTPNCSISDTIEKVIERACLSLNSISKAKQIPFYAKLARELVKFYTAPENKQWVEMNKIPLKDSRFLQNIISWLTFARELAIRVNDHSLIDDIDRLHQTILKKNFSNPVDGTQSTGNFFRTLSENTYEGKKSTDAIQLIFCQKFKLHLENFYSSYNIPIEKLDSIFEHLIQFIKKQASYFNLKESRSDCYPRYTFY